MVISSYIGHNLQCLFLCDFLGHRVSRTGIVRQIQLSATGCQAGSGNNRHPAFVATS